jgi:hypothetical protein
LATKPGVPSSRRALALRTKTERDARRRLTTALRRFAEATAELIDDLDAF